MKARWFTGAAALAAALVLVESATAGSTQLLIRSLSAGATGQSAPEGSGSREPMLPPPTVIEPPDLPPAAGPDCLIDPPAPIVVIRVRVVACANPGEKIEYLLRVENLSPAAAHHVLVRNPLPKNARFVSADPMPDSREGELQWKLGTLPGCACKNIRLTLEPTDAQDVRNCARVQFEHGQCVVTRISRAQPPPIPQQPGATPPPRPTPVPGVVGELKLKISGPKTAFVAASVPYTIDVENTGKGPVTNGVVTCRLPEGLAFVAASGEGRYLAGQAAWVFAGLAPGERLSYTLTVKATRSGKHCLKPVAIADHGVDATAEACTEFRAVSALLFRMSDSRDPVAVGETTKYVIEIVNQGGKPATNLRLELELPARHLKYLNAKGPTIAQVKGKPATGQRITFAPLTQLAPGAAAKFEVTVQALMEGNVKVRAVLAGDPLVKGGPVLEEEPTTIFRANNGQGPTVIESRGP